MTQLTQLNWHSFSGGGLNLLQKKCFMHSVISVLPCHKKIGLPRQVRCMNAQASQSCSQVQLSVILNRVYHLTSG